MNNSMENVLVEVYLPAAGKKFEISIPGTMNTVLAARLTASALSRFSEGTYKASRTSMFVWQKNGKSLNPKMSMKQEHVINGSKLLLI